MFCRWAAVSFTLPTARGLECGSSFFEQPLKDAAAAIATTATASDCLVFMLVRYQIRAVPPPASQGLKQSRGIGIAAGLCLHQIDLALLIGLLGAQQRQIPGVAGVPLPLR